MDKLKIIRAIKRKLKKAMPNTPVFIGDEEFEPISLNQAVRDERASRDHPPFAKITFKK